MEVFRAIMYAHTEDDALLNFERAMERAQKFSNFQNHMSKLWNRRHLWCLAWRDHPSFRGHHTNNIAEATVRLYKDQVLRRCKAYNLVALVDFTTNVMEAYYSNRLLDFAHCRVTKPFLMFDDLTRKASYITSKDLIICDGDSRYKVCICLTFVNSIILYIICT